MTPKQIVLEKWPHSELIRNISHYGGTYNYNYGIIFRTSVIGTGKTPRQAWASAAETVRRGK